MDMPVHATGQGECIKNIEAINKDAESWMLFGGGKVEMYNVIHGRITDGPLYFT